MHSILKYATPLSGECGWARWNHRSDSRFCDLAPSSSRNVVRNADSVVICLSRSLETVCRTAHGLCVRSQSSGSIGSRGSPLYDSTIRAHQTQVQRVRLPREFQRGDWCTVDCSCTTVHAKSGSGSTGEERKHPSPSASLDLGKCVDAGHESGKCDHR